mmetsp:Transcript_65271/g.202113  ORF Transcript_65271/g.202113 Transcript_65271/m.202113 type:complete len:519 (+) Transcript_65271:89-1645(+)
MSSVFSVTTVNRLKVWSPANGPRQVFFSVQVKLLYDMDCVKQNFKAKLLLRLQWMLSEDEKKQWQSDRSQFKTEWTPPVVDVPNAMDMSVETSEVSVELLGDMLTGKCSQLLSGTFIEVMELHNFPFDIQEFKLLLKFPESDEKFQIHPAADHPQFVQMTQDAKMLPEYVFKDPVVDIGGTSVQELQKDFTYKTVSHPTIVLHLQASRAWMAYINKTVVTLALVSAAVMFAFLIPRDELSDRLSHTTTLFLTAVAFQLVVSQSLPQIDYMTLMDKYIRQLNLFILAVMGTMAFTYNAGSRESEGEKFLEDFDRWAMRLAGAIWLSIHVIFALRGFLARRGTKCLSAADALAREADSAQFGASSHYTVKVGSARRFFGNLSEYQAAAQTTEDLTFWAGIWYSEDVYRDNGIEYVYFFVQVDGSGTTQLMARKITGDQNVPCGRITIQTTKGVPEVGGPGVPIQMLARSNIDDKDGFEFTDGMNMLAGSANELVIRNDWIFIGSFRRQNSLPKKGSLKRE